MTANELIRSLSQLPYADREQEVLIWDPDGDGLLPVTGYTYGAEEPESITLFTDTDEEAQG